VPPTLAICRYLALALSFAIAACGGEVPGPGPSIAGGIGGASGAAGSSGVGGTGGAGGTASVDMCVLTSMKVCQNAGCHGSPPVSSGLALDNDVLTRDFAMLVDKPNQGDPGGCMAGKYKLIDSADPGSSLIYTKLPDPATSPPCGLRMPVIGNFAAADKMCILSWINSVIAAK
jgi:hypothetical protein